MRFFYVIPRRFVSGVPKRYLYFWGKGARKQKSEHYRPRQCDFKNEACDAYAPSRELAKNLENPSNSRLFRREFFSGLMVAFLQCVKHSIWGPRGILCTRGAYGHLQKVGFFIFSKILAFSERLFLCFFEYRNIMCAD